MTIDLDLVPPAEPPTPAPRRRRAGVAGALVVAVAAVALVALVLRPQGPPAPPPPPAPPTDGPLAWVEKLVNGPARGALAQDTGFLEDLLGEVNRILHDSTWRPVPLWAVDDRPHDDLAPSLLFADDIGDHRIVVLALRLPSSPDPSGMGRTSVAWLSGPRGATAGLLTSALGRRPLADAHAGRAGAAPLTVVEAGPQTGPDSNVCDAQRGCVWVGLAPDGCTVATSPATDGRTWTTEPTESYVVRTTATWRAEYWRVTCEGVVRELRPAPKPVPIGLPDDVMSPAAADFARIVGDNTYDLAVRSSASALLYYDEFGLAGPPRVIWAGQRRDLPDPITDGPPVAGWAALLAAPSGRSTWYVGASYYATVNGILNSGGFGFVELSIDPNRPESIIACDISSRTPTFLVLARAAASVRLLHPDGETLLEVPVVDGAAVITPPADATILVDPVTGQRHAIDGLRVAVLDREGSIAGTSDLPTRTTANHHTYDWD